MSALVFGVVLICCFTIVGFPWLPTGWRSTGIAGVITSSSFLGYLVMAIAGTWSVGLLGDEWLSVLISLICGCIATCLFKGRGDRGRPRGIDKRFASISFALTISVLLIAGISVSQQGDFGVGIRVGPDAIGNAIASDAIAGKTVAEIEKNLKFYSSEQSMDELLSTRTRLLYKLPHLRDQVSGEFLVAGLRWGLPSTVSAIQGIPNALDVYRNLELLAIFALLLTCHLLYVGLRFFETPRALASLFAIASSLSTPLLAGWREGGYSQIYALPAFIYVIGTWSLGGTERRRLRMDTAAALAACLVIYSDMFILAIAIAGFTLLLRAGNSKIQINLLRRYVTETVVALLLVLPYSLRFVSYLPRRLEDSSIGGWSLPHWPNVAELLGFVNGFNQLAPVGLVNRSGVLSIIGTIFTPVLLALWTVILLKSRISLTATTVSAISIVLALVYIKARFIDDASNYQIFKAAGCLAPVLLLGGYICAQDSQISRLAGSRTARHVLLAVSASLIISSLNYQTEFNSQSVLVNETTLGRPPRTLFGRPIDEVNLVGPSTLEFTALNALDRFAWYGRASFGLMELSNQREALPLFLVVSNQFCALRCKRGLDTGQIEKFGKAFVVIPLAKNSEILTTLEGPTYSKNDLVTQVNRYLRSMDLPQLDINFNPTTSI